MPGRRPTRVERVEATVASALGELGTATVHEAMGRRGMLDPRLRPRQVGARIAGCAVTVVCPPGDNLMVHVAVAACAPGDVLVVTTSAPSRHGMVGELLACSLVARGVVGLVIDAGVRDTSELRAMSFPVWSRHVCIEGTVKVAAGSLNVPVVLGGVPVAAGDVVCADDDGVVVVPGADAADVLARGRRRLEQEAALRQRLVAGELTIDMLGLRHLLDGSADPDRRGDI